MSRQETFLASDLIRPADTITKVCTILAEAISQPADSAGLFTTILDRFGALGGVDLDLPGRDKTMRAS